MTEATKYTKPPELTPGGDNAAEWVTYLQQLLNYFYGMQVVNQDGDFGARTRQLVAHVREHLGLGEGETVDEALWKGLGDQSEDLRPFDDSVDVMNLQATEETCWAGAIAVLNRSHGKDENDAPKVVAKAGAPERRTATEGKTAATGSCGQHVQRVAGDNASSWSDVLRKHGVAWLPDPTNDQCALVVTGLKIDGDVQVRVANPCQNNQEWYDFTAFAGDHGLTAEEIEVISG